jgi:GMP synthase (glutamine-hydrolysing)
VLSTFKKATDSALDEIQEEMRVRQTKEVFLLFAMGSQFDHLIKQALEKLGVFCLVADPSSVRVEDVQRLSPAGIILSGGPASVQSEPPRFDGKIFELEIPVLGICLGFQMWAHHAGFKVTSSGHREFGVHDATLDKSSKLFMGCGAFTSVLESHGDRVEPHEGLHILATTDNAPVAAARYHNLWGVQFHPEVSHTTHGLRMLENFCFQICGAKDCFPATNVGRQKIKNLREQIGDRRVLLALSGGSDSSTVAYLLKDALCGEPGRMRAIYIRGIDRPDDEAFVMKYFGEQPWLELKVVDATEQFLEVLKGHQTMKAKRVAMRGVYKSILEREAEQFEASFIAQGTLYTDISESGGGYDAGARKAQIKLHHNTNLDFKLPELLPLADCVKDNGRNIGRSIGVPEELLVRHPFPGPGLVVRIECEVTADKLVMARAVDCIWIEELRKWQLYDTVWQAGAVITQSVTTCTKGDDATSGVVVALWAVWSVNGFTATAAELPNDFLRHVARRITNEVRAVGAVVYRLSDKPPATIEWG